MIWSSLFLETFQVWLVHSQRFFSFKVNNWSNWQWEDSTTVFMEVCTNELHLCLLPVISWDGVLENLHHLEHLQAVLGARTKLICRGQIQVDMRHCSVLRNRNCKKWLGEFLHTLQASESFLQNIWHRSFCPWKNQGCSCRPSLQWHLEVLKPISFSGWDTLLCHWCQCT